MKYRNEQLAEQIVQIANTMLKTRVEIPPGVLVSVVACTFSNDRREAALIVSVLPEERRGTGLGCVRSIVGALRMSVGKLYALKYTPTISVCLADADWYKEQYEQANDAE